MMMLSRYSLHLGVKGMRDESSRDEYLKHFSGDGRAGERQKEALKQALENRRFEYDLYWKRAAYFWAFIAASFAGYFAVQKEDAHQSFESTYVITCLGFVFSLAWYLVNRGSKAWMRNWEIQVDLLEDEVMGPLYKSTLNRYTHRFWHLTEAFPFSPSRINQILGLLITLVWLFLVVRSLLTADWSRPSHSWTAGVMSGLTLACIAMLFRKSGAAKTDATIPVLHRMRRYEDISRRGDSKS